MSESCFQCSWETSLFAFALLCYLSSRCQSDMSSIRTSDWEYETSSCCLTKISTTPFLLGATHVYLPTASQHSSSQLITHHKVELHAFQLVSHTKVNSLLHSQPVVLKGPVFVFCSTLLCDLTHHVSIVLKRSYSCTCTKTSNSFCLLPRLCALV